MSAVPRRSSLTLVADLMETLPPPVTEEAAQAEREKASERAAELAEQNRRRKEEMDELSSIHDTLLHSLPTRVRDPNAIVRRRAPGAPPPINKSRARRDAANSAWMPS